ncbi:hypothetical protein Glove_41g79 [Diversispora epigaea]|uniref:Uncharacterized protein n=1 Tax=Diversispora epigaea TaxID=1348612 RepID=A0A397JLX4_9GLOM|nr:hypothetical protein Glove_41g79 [Diversispora epigaea]
MKSIILLNLLFCLLLLITLNEVQYVQSAITPNFPIGDSILKPGDEIKITWLEDTNKPLLSELPNVLIEFMTGSDMNQIPLKTIATVDAILKSCDWTVPAVEPAGQIYFLRFTSTSPPSISWSTRFTITDSLGNYPPIPSGPKPESGKNPGGVGHLVTSTNTNNNSTATNFNNIETANTTTKKNSITGNSISATGTATDTATDTASGNTGSTGITPTTTNTSTSKTNNATKSNYDTWYVTILSFVVFLSSSLLIKN